MAVVLLAFFCTMPAGLQWGRWFFIHAKSDEKNAENASRLGTSAGPKEKEGLSYEFPFEKGRKMFTH